MTSYPRLCVVLICLAAGGCHHGSGGNPDGGNPDGGSPDGGNADGGGIAPDGGGSEDGSILGFGQLVDHSDALPQNNQSTTDVQLVDIDGDGDLDILWANQAWPPGTATPTAGAFEVTINDGAGKFHKGVLGVEPKGWQFILPVDVDGDGDIDLVLSQVVTVAPAVTLLLNDGKGNFSLGSLPPIVGATDGMIYGRVVAADVDKDGRPDLIVPIFGMVNFDANINPVSTGADMPNILLMNQGGGVFMRDTSGRLPPIPAGTDYTESIAVGDVNGDGAPDLFFGEAENTSRLLINDGTGHFSDQTMDDGKGMPRLTSGMLRPYHSAMTDIDGDGDLDVIVINDASLDANGKPQPKQNLAFANDGTGHFVFGWMAPTLAERDSRGLAFGDINHDGILDVIVGNATQHLDNQGFAIEVAMGTGAGQFALLPGMGPWKVGVFGVAMGDLNGDGFADVVGAVAEPDAAGNMSNILLLSEPKK
jgi:hypothetical protein